jgi:type II secretory pathway pseudopilin PulG
MTRRLIATVLAVAVLALMLAAAAPRAEAISFVDKQVQAGGLLIQNYIDKYGMAHQFVFPEKAMVKKGGGLPDSTLMWPANPWTGKTMGPGTARGTYTYVLAAGGTSYRLTMHFSKGSYVFRGSLPSWLKGQRDTASLQNALLLQRYLDAYKATNIDFPATGSLNATTLAGYSWPKNAWTGADMAAGDTFGDFSYTRISATDFTLKVKLSNGKWSSAFGPVSVISRLTVTPGG